MTNKLIIFSVILNILACSHAEKQFESDIAAGRCNEALTNLPQKDPLVKITGHTKQAAGTVASYAFVGASYTVQVLWDVVGGTVGFIALCGPTMVASVASNGGGSEQLRCLPGDVKPLLAPHLGRKAIEDTRHMRCPDLKSFSQSLRAVASCYEKIGGEENLQKAVQSLESVKTSGNFYSCLPTEERDKVDAQLHFVQDKLGK